MNFIPFLFEEINKNYDRLLNMYLLDRSNTVIIEHEHFKKNLLLKNISIFNFYKLFYTNLKFQNISCQNMRGKRSSM